MIFSKNNTIKTKITALALLATAIIIIMSFVTYVFTDYLKNSFVAMQAKELKVKNISYSLKDKISNLHKSILTQSLLQKDDKINIQTIETFNKEIMSNFKEIHSIMASSNNEELLEILDKLNIRYESYYDMAKRLPNKFSLNLDEGLDDLAGINAISEKMFEELDFFIVKSNDRFNYRLQRIDENMTNMLEIFFTVSIVSLLVFLIFGYILQHTILNSLKNLANGIDGFFKFLSQKTTELKDIEIIYNDELGEIVTKINEHIHEAEALIDNERKFKENLEKKVAEELEKNLQKELILFEQSKMASMGEMIGNIAHQWRQPLSLISTCATSIIIRKELDALSDEQLFEMCEKINESTQRLSGIITTFRNYLMETKEVRDVVLQETVKQSLEIINITLADNSIKLMRNIEENSPIIIQMVSGELSEVIINIINNAKDILLEKNTETPWVVVELKKLQEKVIITIEDNAGGVPSHIIDKIFEQNFTTKDKSHGTGLGLYMSYRIVTESLNGNLYVENTSNGAKFFIELPLTV
jgi:signal transduction histidine kinase